MAKLVQPTSDWAPDYVKAREDGGGEERCPAFPRDIIRNQTDLTYVDVDCASTRGHQDFPASTRGEKLQGSGVELSTSLRKVSQCSVLRKPTNAFYNFTLSTSVIIAESSSSKECGGSSLEPVSECEEDEGLSMRRNLAP